MIDAVVELSNIEIHEHCMLNRITGEREYNICIQYRTSQYVGFDVWSDEKDVDLFYQIEQSYKDNEYYKKFTK